MKKSLLALAVLTAFASAASAQSSVTIYGIVDVSIGRIDDGTGSTNRLDSGRDAASRVGFKGVEDLGNGLKATFLLENGFVSDTGALSGNGGLFNRLSYVGLESNTWGGIRLGRQDSPMRTALNVIDPFANAGMAGAIDYFGYSDAAGQTSTTPERVSNQITYLSPKFGGFSGSAAYNFGETRGSNSANRGYAGQIGYADGALSIQAAYADQNETVGGVDLSDAKNALIGATFNLGAFKLHGGYKTTKVEDNVTGGDITKVRSYLIGATVPFGANTIRASYINNDVRNVTDADTQFLALSYSYALSKRTSLYATYVHVNNDSAAAMGAVNVDEGTLGQNSNGIALGIKHTF